MDVEFDDNPISPQQISVFKVKEASLFMRLVKKTGLVKTDGQAFVVLIVVVMLFIFGTALLVYTRIIPQNKTLTQEELPEDVKKSFPPELLNKLYPKKTVQ
jgi:hypothetical protein